MMNHHLLKSITGPADVRRLSRVELKQLAIELRDFVLQSVSQTGGHLSSNLGTVELTVALHHVFNTPHDRLVWDVGHQTYPHKILTGRRDRMPTLRQLGGISGFPRRDESEYDTFGTAHSSTSISAALGMAIAAKMKGEHRKAVAIIGDGAMTAGMAFEALNNAGMPHAVRQADMLVILNDNDMSISPPVGALNRYLARLMSGKFYAAAREGAKQVLKNAPPLFELAPAASRSMPRAWSCRHDLRGVRLQLRRPDRRPRPRLADPDAREPARPRGPQFLHVVTKKGYGYKLAEADPVNYHGPGKFDPAVGLVKPTTAPKTDVHRRSSASGCATWPRRTSASWASRPAMREGSGMVEFEKRFPVALPRRRHRRAACGDVCRRARPARG
jgi:1-deoxy-D-xylulose-5-phosphate synthase